MYSNARIRLSQMVETVGTHLGLNQVHILRPCSLPNCIPGLKASKIEALRNFPLRLGFELADRCTPATDHAIRRRAVRSCCELGLRAVKQSSSSFFESFPPAIEQLVIAISIEVTP